MNWYVEHLWNWSEVNATQNIWFKINIGLGNGLVASGNKVLPEPMLTQILCRHMMSHGHNELTPSLYLHIVWTTAHIRQMFPPYFCLFMAALMITFIVNMSLWPFRVHVLVLDSVTCCPTSNKHARYIPILLYSANFSAAVCTETYNCVVLLGTNALFMVMLITALWVGHKNDGKNGTSQTSMKHKGP